MPSRAPAHLGTRGRRLWRELVAEAEPGPAEAVLIEEACRIADRLDRLDALLRGDEDLWFYIDVPEVGDRALRLVVNGALGEARQQAATLKQLVGEIRQLRGSAKKPTGQGGALDQLAAARAKRLADASGQ